MAGIYLHIPFCKQACHYCDFHFSTHLANIPDVLRMMERELVMRKDYLSDEPIETIYFGGGTPSIIDTSYIAMLLEKVNRSFNTTHNMEVTLEVNPDDISALFLRTIKNQGINRLSIGVQTFDDGLLKFLNRSHNGRKAEDSIKMAQDRGLDNITADLIYGIPAGSHQLFHQDLTIMTGLQIPHISAYCLTIEDKTVFGNRLRKKKMKALNEEFSATQFEMLMESLEKNGYLQYEISNFAKKERYSRHNSNYWKGAKYLGIGPGAHSYDIRTRQYNISNNNIYIERLKQNEIPATIEELTSKDQLNEYLLTSIRTIWGTDLHKIKEDHGGLPSDWPETIQELKKNGLIFDHTDSIILTKKGKLLADEITSQLFQA